MGCSDGFKGCLWSIVDISMFSVFETNTFSPNLLLQIVEAVLVVFVKSKGATPESTVNVGGFVSIVDLGLGGAVYWRQIVHLAGEGANHVDFAETRHMMEELRVQCPAAQARAGVFASLFGIEGILGLLPVGRR